MSYVWGNYCPQGPGQNVLCQLNLRIFVSVISPERTEAATEGVL